jgi:CheY-like chemotaxis protein
LKLDARTKEIPVILVAVSSSREAARNMGAQGCLAEPFAQAELLDELQQVSAMIDALRERSQYRPWLAENLPEVADRKLILVADDNQVTVDLLKDFLEGRHYRVLAVGSGSEMMESLEQVQPDLLLVDIQMPGMSGYEVIAAVRAHATARIAHLPVIAITALAMAGDRDRCLQAGANLYMSKPLPLVKLLENIQVLLHGR